jgi:phage gp16-like protein
MEPIRKKQIQIIKIGQKQLGLCDDIYREMLENRFGVSSCTRLSKSQADKLIEMFIQRGFKIASKRRKHTGKRSIPMKGTNIVRIVSNAELRKISVLNSLIGWETGEGFEKWMAKHFKISKVRTARDAFLVIEGLKGVFENKMKKEHGKDWWTKEFTEKPIQEYVKRYCPLPYRQ